MEPYCVLCGRYVEVIPDQEVYTLRRRSGETEEFVCDHCINHKLNFGEPVHACLYCNSEEDYILQPKKVIRGRMEPAITSIRRGKPMVCEEHFQHLIEEDQDHTLSIEDVLADEEQLERPTIKIPGAIGQEEGQHLEYKETFQYDPYNEKQDKSLKANTVEEVAAFGNTEGGVVVIGVEDDTKEVRGLKGDYDTMGGGRDKFASQVMDVISDRIDQTFASRYVKIEFYKIDGQEICAIHVNPSPNALTVDDEFYIRQGSSSQALNKDETIDYLSDRWNN